MNPKLTSSDEDDIPIPFPPMTGAAGQFVDKPEPVEYIVVSDINSVVLASNSDFSEIRKVVSLVRKAGGAVTVFKATKY